MKITKIQVFSFELPLKRAFTVGQTVVKARRGFLLMLHGANGKIGLGEASPLPGLHKESAEQVRQELLAIKRQFNGMTCAPLKGDWLRALFDCLDDARLCPSVRFAVESALIDLWRQQKPPVLPDTFLHLKNTIRVNALIYGDEKQILQQARQKIQEGYQSLKIKVGRIPVEQELSLLHKLLSFLPSGILLRLDANRSWTLEQALRLGELPTASIEYVEEPLQNTEDLPHFFEQTHIPIALDETIMEWKNSLPFVPTGLSALVLKPSLLGGWISTFHWAEWAKSNGLKAIISDTVSSGVGLQMATRLAALVDPLSAHGLDTYRLLADDLLAPALDFAGGQLSLLSTDELRKRLQWERLEAL